MIDTTKKPVKILSLDGGGIFGCSVTCLLKDYDVAHDFDVFGGTSIGSILAAWFAMGKPADKLHTLFMEALPQIFKREWWDVGRKMGLKAKWPSKALNAFLQKYFAVKLGDLHKPVFLPSVDSVTCKPKVYTNLDYSDWDIPLWRALRHSVAAPSFFATGRFLDGGLFANNPSTVVACGIHQKINTLYSDMHMLSLGTGKMPTKKCDYDPDDEEVTDSWHLLQWAIPVIKTQMELNITGFDYLTKQLDLGRYRRIDGIVYDTDWEMDDASIMPDVCKRAEHDMKDELAIAYEAVIC